MADYKYRTRKLDSNGDIATSGTVWIYDIEAVAQTINTRLNLFAAEYWRDVSEGVPWMTDILGKNNTKNTLQSKTTIIRNRILNTDGVISIVEWDSDFSYTDRKFSINATVLTEFGLTTVSGESTEADTEDEEEIESINSMLIAVQRYAIAATEVSTSI